MAIVIAAALSLNACWFSRKPKAQAPSPPQQQTTGSKPSTAASQEPRAKKTTRPAPAAKKAAKRKPKVSTSRAASPAAVPPIAAEPKKPLSEPTESQGIGRILTGGEADQYQDSYRRSVSSARQLLQGLTGRALTPEKLDAVGRIRSFLAQALEASASDWPAAAQLARRAEVLARDLVRSLQ